MHYTEVAKGMLNKNKYDNLNNIDDRFDYVKAAPMQYINSIDIIFRIVDVI